MKLSHVLYCIFAFGFTLGVYQGKLALWKDEGKIPVEIFPFSVSALPEADQKLLEAGIPIDDIRQLTARLEDYFS